MHTAKVMFFTRPSVLIYLYVQLLVNRCTEFRKTFNSNAQISKGEITLVAKILLKYPTFLYSFNNIFIRRTNAHSVAKYMVHVIIPTCTQKMCISVHSDLNYKTNILFAPNEHQLANIISFHFL